jgi:hypothetical protein
VALEVVLILGVTCISDRCPDKTQRKIKIMDFFNQSQIVNIPRFWRNTVSIKLSDLADQSKYHG